MKISLDKIKWLRVVYYVVLGDPEIFETSILE